MRLKELVAAGAMCVGIPTHAAILYLQWPVAAGGNGHWYGLTETPVSWSEGEATALAEGGHLASIGSLAEQTFLATTFAPGVYYWIGFSDAAAEGTWAWSDGSAVTYENWAAGEPNDWPDSGIPHQEDYAIMNWSGVQWNDLGHIPDYTYGIVEVVPEPHAYAAVTAGLTLGFGIWHRRRSRA